MELPYDAQLVPAPTKRFRETVVIVHHFGGSTRTTIRHVKFLNSMGFDVVRFPLLFNDLKFGQHLPITSGLKFGVSQVWTEQIEGVLNAIPGRKILYTFSMPSIGALGAIARRKATDIAGWVCDGGPFLQVLRCSWNLLAYEYKVDNLFLRGLYTAGIYFLFGTGTEITIPLWCSSLPAKFPVLSIRGEKDPLVPPSAINDVFAFAPQIELQKVSLSDGGHLDGLKKFPSLYDPPTRAFLTRIATPI